MTSDVARRKVVLERLHAYNDTLSGVQKWRGLADQTDKQLKNKIEALMKKGKSEIEKHIAPLLSGARTREANSPVLLCCLY